MPSLGLMLGGWGYPWALELDVLIVFLILKSVEHFMYSKRWVIPVGGNQLLKRTSARPCRGCKQTLGT